MVTYFLLAILAIVIGIAGGYLKVLYDRRVKGEIRCASH